MVVSGAKRQTRLHAKQAAELLPKRRHTFSRATSAVLTVGRGRGFVLEGINPAHEHLVERYVITAAHCLNRTRRSRKNYFPPCAAASYVEQRTYRELLGPLGDKPTVWAECLFVDPVADAPIPVRFFRPRPGSTQLARNAPARRL